MGRKSIFLIMVVAALSVTLMQAQEIKVPLRFDYYYSYEKMAEAMKRMMAFFMGYSGLNATVRE